MPVPTRPREDRGLAAEAKGDCEATLSSGPPPPEFERDGTVASEDREATTDCAELRPRLFNEMGCTRRSMSSRCSEPSRAMTRVMSRSVLAPTSAKVRLISSAELARDGERVVSGPETTTPRAPLSAGMTREPGWTTRERCSLAKSSVDTTFHPARSISATRT